MLLEVVVVGGLAAALQIAGYGLYIRSIVHDRIVPNPVSWLMFAYGTALVVVLEVASDAPLAVLFLPTACAAMSIVVALLCFRRAANDQIDRLDGMVFAVDIVFTAIYVGTVIHLGSASALAPPMLVAGSLLTIATFLPLLRATRRNAHNERAEPWLVWTGAYALLLVATLLADGLAHPALLAYPAVNLVLHALMLSLVRKHVPTSLTGAKT